MMHIVDLFLFGFVLTAAIGLFASWFERTLTARVQYRVGPPLLQPVYDLIKLLGKETLVPTGASKITFFAAPTIALASVIVVSMLLWSNMLCPQTTFLGDLIVTLYFLTVPSLCMIMGGFASRNPYASLGASREMKLILSYELPFLLAVFVAVIKANFSIRLGDMVLAQHHQGIFAASISGVVALVVSILCIQAKLGIAPFDIAEAETEIVSGPLIEYSGVGLALFRLAKNMLLCTLPLFLMVLFFGGIQTNGLHLLYGALIYLGIVAVIAVIKNTNPRVRIDHAVRFFWGPVTLLAILAVVLALKGL